MLDPKILKNGEEQYETYESSADNRRYLQYDYRSANGKLSSCVQPYPKDEEDDEKALDIALESARARCKR